MHSLPAYNIPPEGKFEFQTVKLNTILAVANPALRGLSVHQIQQRVHRSPAALADTVLRWLQVQMDIREGHAVTVDKVLRWISEDGNVKGVSICDAGRHSSPLLSSTCILESVRRTAPVMGRLSVLSARLPSREACEVCELA